MQQKQKSIYENSSLVAQQDCSIGTLTEMGLLSEDAMH